MNSIELRQFNSIYQAAGGFIRQATDDYVASRCCLLNGLFTGLPLGAEAVEKYLKGFVLYGGDNRKYRHSINNLAAAASNIKPAFSTAKFSHVIDRLEMHYCQRYPDVPDFNFAASTAELAGIDELVLHIYDSLPIPETAKFHNYGYFFFLFSSRSGALRAYKEWLERENVALKAVRDSLLQRYHASDEQLRRT